MKPIALLTLLLGGTVVFGQQQTVKIVTSDVTTGPMASVAPGGLQPMKAGSGIIFGQVTEADSNRPVPGAIVTINLPGAQPLRVMADGQGRFGFRQMPAGAFNVTATRPGWVDGAFGRSRPGGPLLPILLGDGDRVSGVTVPMWRYATIAGTVVDEAGDPVIGAPVRVLKRSLLGGRTTLKEYQQDTTDDRGVYRISQLEPGDYVVAVPMQQPMSDMPFSLAGAEMKDVMVARAVSVSSSGGGGGAIFMDPGGGGASAGLGEDGRPLAFATSFYPNAAVSTRAQLVTVGSGEERSAVDFQLHAVPTSKITGTATGPDGVVPNLQITLVPAEADDHATSIETLNGFSDGQGHFTIEGVPPGQYVLRATRTPRVAMPGNMFRATVAQGGQVIVSQMATANGPTQPLPNDPTLWAEMMIGVANKDVSDLSVSLRPGVKMTGMVQFNGTAQRPAPDSLNGAIGVVLEPAEQHQGVSNAIGRVDANGNFTSMGVPPGQYFVRIKAALSGWTLQSVLVNGRDASVVPVDVQADLGGVQITFTDRPTELSGQVTSDGPVEAATVLVFPAESQSWVDYGSQSRRFSNVRVDKSGNFKVTSLPAGDYLAVAIPDKMANDWQDPKFLESLVGDAVRVHVRDNEKVTASLKVAR